jgi:hypothetical protein
VLLFPHMRPIATAAEISGETSVDAVPESPA